MEIISRVQNPEILEDTMDTNNTNTATSTTIAKTTIKDRFNNLPKPVKIGLTVTGIAAVGVGGYMAYEHFCNRATPATDVAETVAETVAATVQQSL